MSNVKVEDKSYGTSNFNSWNFRVLIIFEENDLLEIKTLEYQDDKSILGSILPHEDFQTKISVEHH